MFKQKLLYSMLVAAGFMAISFGLAQVSLAAYNATSVIGQRNFTSGIVNGAEPSSVSFNQPWGIELDTTYHRLFVADANNSRVLVFDLDEDNQLIDRIADKVIGQTDFSSSTLGTTQSGFNSPRHMLFDSVNNRLYLAECNNNRVLVFDTNTITNGEDAINVLGQPNFTSNTAATTQTGMNCPRAVALDSARNLLFVSEINNNRITIFDVATIANGEAAVNVFGQANFTTATATTTQTGLSGPRGLVFNSNNKYLYVAVPGSNRVLVYDTITITDNQAAVHVLGQANFTAAGAATTQAGMNFPNSVELDATNNLLYVPQPSSNRITIYDVTTISNGENAVNVLGQPNFTSSTVSVTQNKVIPYDASLDSDNGLLYVGDSYNRVMIFDVNSISDGENAVDVIGQYDFNGNPSYTTNGANAGIVSPNGFYYPQGSALDLINHRLFIPDAFNHRVLIYNLDSENNLIDSLADNVLGQSSFNTSTSATTQTGMFVPSYAQVDTIRNLLFISDQGNRRVLVFDVATITDGEAAINVLGQANFTTGTSGRTASTFSQPNGILYDVNTMRLYVSDSTNNHRILVFDVTTITDGEAAINVLGQANFTNGGGATSATRVSGPSGLALDTANNYLFVNDYFNKRVLVFDVTTITDGEAAIYVLGQPDFTTVSNIYSASAMNGSLDLAYDASKNHLIVFGGGSGSAARILFYDTATIVNNEPAYAIIGQTNFTNNQAGTTQSLMSRPIMSSYDASKNRLYVSDNENHRLLIFDLVTFPDNQTLAPAPVSKEYNQTIQTTQSQGDVSIELVSGTLPPGLSIEGISITGTPEAIGDYTFTLRAFDDNGDIGTFRSEEQSFTISTTRNISSGSSSNNPGNSNINPSYPSIPTPGQGSTNVSSTNSTPFKTGQLVFDNGTIYIITPQGTKAGFTSMNAFNYFNFSVQNVLTASTATIPQSDTITEQTTTHPDGTLILSTQDNRTVYLVSSNTLYAFPTLELFLSKGFLLKDIVPSTQQDLSLPFVVVQ